METLFVIKAVAREGKTQLCFSVKGRSAEGRYYRVINKSADEDISRARTLIDKHRPLSLKELLEYYDGVAEDGRPLTIGMYLESYMNEQRHPSSGKMHSGGWRITQTLLNKLKGLGMDSILMKDADNRVFERFCDSIRAGKAPSTRGHQDQGCHGYRITVSLFKTLLNKAYRDHLITEPITYNWHSDDKMPVATRFVELPRMNVPTEEEWQKFLSIDLRRFTYSNRDIHKLEMMRAVVIVLVETLSRPVDVLTMRCDGISNMSWSYVPTKFKQYPIEKKRRYMKPIGLTNLAYKMIMRYRGKSGVGYVFPFQCNLVEEPDENAYITRIANMGGKINSWLKLLTHIVFEKDVSLYSFRHFAITRALNCGMSVSEVATLAKTSIQQINNTYYERDGIKSMDKLEKLLNKS